MADPFDLATVARVIGEPARAAILARLLAGSAAPAGELAREAGISPQTASGHLSQLLDAGLVVVATQGRHRYYRLAGPDIARALEVLSVLPTMAVRPSRVPEALRFARSCYNHLAGGLAVRLAAVLVERRHVIEHADVFTVTDDGRTYLTKFGVRVEQPDADLLIGRACMDWSERRPHVGGALGTALLGRFLALKWLARTKVPRALRLTVDGRHALDHMLGLRLDGF